MTYKYANAIIDRLDFWDKDVLEVGCGRGDFTLTYLGQARTVVGVDPEAEDITHIREAWPQAYPDTPATFTQGEIESMALPADAFDLGVFSRSL